MYRKIYIRSSDNTLIPFEEFYTKNIEKKYDMDDKIKEEEIIKNDVRSAKRANTCAPLPKVAGPLDPHNVLHEESDLETYKYEEYVTDINNIGTMLKEKGVAIIPNILNEKECISMLNGAWDYLEKITENWNVPINRNNKKSWRQFSDLFVLHSMLIQHHKIGHAQFFWDMRQNPKVIEVFKKLWNTEELLTSFDGASIHLPPEETNKGWFRNNMWLHTDQSFTRNEFECAQAWVTALDVREGDAPPGRCDSIATLAFLEGSHIYHGKVAKKFNITDKADWYKLNEEETLYYKKLGCKLRRIKCPAGSIVLWDSRTIHMGQEAMKTRKKPNFRCVGYVCMLPKNNITETNLKKKRKMFDASLRERRPKGEEMRTTTHHPLKVKVFAKNPRTYGKEMKEISDIDKPVLTELGKKIAGLI
jgi:hypothetical protein